MSGNYGIRYPYDNAELHDETNNYGAWIPRTPIEDMLDENNGKHHHEFIPKDYVPKNQRTEEI